MKKSKVFKVTVQLSIQATKSNVTNQMIEQDLNTCLEEMDIGEYMQSLIVETIEAK